MAIPLAIDDVFPVAMEIMAGKQCNVELLRQWLTARIADSRHFRGLGEFPLSRKPVRTTIDRSTVREWIKDYNRE